MRSLLVFACLVLVVASCGSTASVVDTPEAGSDAAAGSSAETTTSSSDTSSGDASTESATESMTITEGSADTSTPAAPAPAGLDRVGLLLADCEAGSDMACDVLIMNTERHSPEEDIALTCGGRSSEQVLFCTEGFSHKGRNYWFEADDSPALDGMVKFCEDGDMTACDFLFDRSPVDSIWEAIGDGCNYRIDVAEPDCRTQFAEEFGRCPSDMPGGCE